MEKCKFFCRRCGKHISEWKTQVLFNLCLDCYDFETFFMECQIAARKQYSEKIRNEEKERGEQPCET